MNIENDSVRKKISILKKYDTTVPKHIIEPTEQEWTLETEEIYKGYKIYIMKITNPYPIYWAGMSDGRLYFNGYIILPEKSKFYDKHYNSINEEIRVHGKFTFSEFIDNEYTIGFNTAHIFDNTTTQNVEYVLEELKQAVDQIIEKDPKNKSIWRYLW